VWSTRSALAISRRRISASICSTILLTSIGPIIAKPPGCYSWWLAVIERNRAAACILVRRRLFFNILGPIYLYTCGMNSDPVERQIQEGLVHHASEQVRIARERLVKVTEGLGKEKTQFFEKLP
jgi:hypothetical protein